jgi:hypothetical protein
MWTKAPVRQLPASNVVLVLVKFVYDLCAPGAVLGPPRYWPAGHQGGLREVESYPGLSASKS